MTERPTRPGLVLLRYQLLRFGLFAVITVVLLAVAVLVLALAGVALHRDLVETTIVISVFAAAVISTPVSYFALRRARERAADAVTARATPPQVAPCEASSATPPKPSAAKDTR